MLDDIDAAQNEIEASVMAIRTAKLADLIALVEQRIVEIMAPAAKDLAPPEPSPSSPLPEEPADEAHTHLAVVPPSDQPELPIPSPAAAQPPPIALVRTETAIAEVAFVEPPLATPLDDTKPAPAAPQTSVNTPASPSAPPNPLASIMALSEEERLALFS